MRSLLRSNRVETSPSNKIAINDNLRSEIDDVRRRILEELPHLRSAKSSGRSIGSRIMFLFQRDLVPGISGQVRN